MHEKAQNKPTQKLILGLILASFATLRAEPVSPKPKKTIALDAIRNRSEELSLAAALQLFLTGD